MHSDDHAVRGAPLALDTARLRALPATAEHAAEIQDCFEAAPEYFTATEGAPARPGAAQQLLADAEADECRRVFVLAPRSRRPAVGVLDLHLDYPEPRTAHIGLLLFREGAQGLGFGREVVAALEQALAHAGYHALRLSVLQENAGARLFWERLGFADVGALDRGVTVYEKALG